ncbi:MAG: glycosyltransferase [Bacillota bacterium]
MNNRTKLIIVIILAIIVVLFTYKLYAPYTIQDFNAVNLKNIKQIERNHPDESFSFAVVGNIKNSITIFDNRILQKLQNTSPDFIISTGNNVVNSGEGKYRVLNRTLQRMTIPFVTSVGENEITDEGHVNFYKYFGPYYFSFEINNSYFIFLDTTRHSSDNWQREWLEEELETSQDFEHRFIVMNKAPLEIKGTDLDEVEDKYIPKKEDRDYYQNIFSQYQVDTVFSSNLQLYHQEKIQGVNYIISGGAGGELYVENPNSYYHYLQVNVTPEEINYSVNKLKTNPGIISKTMSNFWVFLQSFLYTNYLNFIIIALILFMVGFLIHREFTREVNYYRDFGFMENNSPTKKLKIAMFTNNYFPTIGGVSISIARLAKGLRKLGHEVYIFAPQYPDYEDKNDSIIRCKLLYYSEKEGMGIPVTNIFSKEINNKFQDLDIDIVHSHHPFWLGKKGILLAHKNNLPAVFTYHTRLEKYAHYLPEFLFLQKFFEKRFSHFMIKRFSNKCEAIFTPTESTKNYLHNVGVKKPIKILPTGIDLQNYQVEQKKLTRLRKKYVDNDEIMLITVSRLSKEKNLFFLMKGIKQIKNKYGDKFRFLIIGDGPEKNNLKEFIDENDLKDNVKLLGEINYKKISKYYLIADIFVFASTTETQGLVLLEAMAGKNPVVAVRSSGTCDIVENEVNGYITDEDIDKWASKVLTLMKDRELRQKFSEKAITTANKYSLKNMAQEAEKVYLYLCHQFDNR